MKTYKEYSFGLLMAKLLMLWSISPYIVYATSDTAVLGDQEQTSAAVEGQPKQDKKPLKKPVLLKPIQVTTLDPLGLLTQLPLPPVSYPQAYVPLVQGVDVATDYSKLGWDVVSFLQGSDELEYAFTGSILWRREIHLIGTCGYSRLNPGPLSENTQNDTEKGSYGSIGFAYFVRQNSFSNLSVGIAHSISHYRLASTTQKLNGYWWELVIRSEQQLLRTWPFYAGFTFHLKTFGDFTSEITQNHLVPGYGYSVNSIVPSVSLYIKYHLSFLKKQISFGKPRGY